MMYGCMDVMWDPGLDPDTRKQTNLNEVCNLLSS